MALSVSMRRTSPTVVENYTRHVNPSFIKLLNVFGYGRVFVRAQGSRVWDKEERSYLDALAGFGAVNLGHNHPRLMARLKYFFEEEAYHFCHAGPSSYQAELAAKLATLLPAPLEMSVFANGGAEAIEIGIKLARAATRRELVLSCRGAFHGTSLATLPLTDSVRLKRPLKPLPLKTWSVPFNDVETLKDALATRQYAAFVVEPVQGEAGVILPHYGYLKEAQRLCRKYGTLLILDEIQTGLARTGRLFSFEEEDVVPDALVLAKALGGGVAPAAVLVTSRDWFRRGFGSVDRFDMNNSTFGGNALACVAALETLDIIRKENLVEKSAERGVELVRLLKSKLRGHPLVREIRGRGLMVAVDTGPTENGWLSQLSPSLVRLASRNVYGQWLSYKLLERGVLCQPAAQAWNILKLTPPLTISPEDVRELADAVAAVFAEYDNIGKLLKDVAARMLSRTRKDWMA